MPDTPDRDFSLDLDSLRFDELGRAPVIGIGSDRELFVDLPGGIAAPQTPAQRRTGEREFLSNENALEL